MCIIIFAWKTVKLHSSCFAEIVTRAHFGSKLTRVKNSAPPFCPGTSNRCVDSGNAIWTSEDIKHRFLCSEPRFYGLPNVQFEFPGVPTSGCFGPSLHFRSYSNFLITSGWKPHLAFNSIALAVAGQIQNSLSQLRMCILLVSVGSVHLAVEPWWLGLPSRQNLNIVLSSGCSGFGCGGDFSLE